MVILRSSEIRNMTADNIETKLKELRKEFMKEKGKIDVGSIADNPGRQKELKKTIARILTIKKEMKSKNAGHM